MSLCCRTCYLYRKIEPFRHFRSGDFEAIVHEESIRRVSNHQSGFFTDRHSCFAGFCVDVNVFDGFSLFRIAKVAVNGPPALMLTLIAPVPFNGTVFAPMYFGDLADLTL